MKSSTLFPRRILLPSFLLSTLAFLLGFGIAYQQDAAYVANFGKLAWLHLSYAEELKDDMAVIDWSKNLEKLDAVKAFQVRLNSKSIAEGGNANFLPAVAPDGVAYRFPSDWSFRTASGKDNASPLEFLLLLHSSPGPFLWGLFTFLACFAGGCALGLLAPSKPAETLKVKATPDGKPGHAKPDALLPTQPLAGPAGNPLDKNTPYLFIDRNYVIREVSPEAAVFLQKKPEDLLNGHLLDLSPDSGLIQAFEKAVEAKIPKSFPDFPDVVVNLKPDPNGCRLILESATGSKPPKKR